MNRLPLTTLLVINLFLVVFALPTMFLFSAPREGAAVDVAYLDGVTFGVLPLTDIVGSGANGRAFSQVLFTELERLRVLSLVPMPQLESALLQVGVAPGTQASYDQIVQAGRGVNADIVLTGTVNNYLMLNDHVSAISVSLVALNMHSGKAVWSETLTRSFENTAFVDEGAKMAATILVERMVTGMEREKRAMRRPAGAAPFAVTTPAPTAGPVVARTPEPTAVATPSLDSVLAGLGTLPAATPRPTPTAPVTQPGAPTPMPTRISADVDALLADIGRNASPSPAPVPTPVSTPAPAPTVLPAPTPVAPPTTVAPTRAVEAPTLPRTTGEAELATLTFATGSADLSSDARSALEAALPAIRHYDRAPVIVSGHTDDSGTETYNSLLAHQRALAAKAFLVERGIPASRVITFGYGPRVPVAANSTPEGQARNRRVELTLETRADRLGYNGTTKAAPRPSTASADGTRPAAGNAAPQTAASGSPMARVGEKAREILARVRSDRDGSDDAAGSGSAPDEAADEFPDDADVPSTTRRSQHEAYATRARAKATGMDRLRVRPGDALRVKVAGHDELDRKVIISPTGLFSYSLIDDFQAAGQTLEQLRTDVQEKLKKFILNASVTARRIHLVRALGEVGRPGILEFDHPPTMLDLIAQAGDARRNVGGSDVVTARILTSEGRVYEVDITELLANGKGNDDLRLFHGDTVVIEPELRDRVYVLGAMANSVLYRHGMCLLDALIAASQGSGSAAVGRPLDEELANFKNVRVIRRQPTGEMLRIEVNLHDILHRGRIDRNVPLQPGDYVVVPRRSQRKYVMGVLGDVSKIVSTILLPRLF